MAGEDGGELHGGAMAGISRCSSNTVYGPLYSKPRAPGERGDDGELG